MIVSPCISICKTDPKSGYCYGCGRTNEEKKIWKLEETSDQWKKDNLDNIKKRLSGWQLKSFEESYTYKIENAIFHLKKYKMNKSTIVIIIYIIGLIFGALFLKIWSADTNIYKGLLGLGWTALFLIGLFFADKHEKS